jgi:DNA polymerase zeta
MFSVRLVLADYYMSPPIPELDAGYSEFRGTEVKQVPVIRVFGSTITGIIILIGNHCG